MIGYDLVLLTPGGTRTLHHEGPIQTDGPWLILYSGDGSDLGPPVGFYPAHAVVSGEPCKGTCDGGR